MSSLPETYQALISNGDHTATVESIPLQPPQPHQILIRVKSVGLNPTDWKAFYANSAPKGVILGCDCAGDVVQVGSDVSHFKVGDIAAGFMFGAGSPENGAFAQYARLDAAVAFKLTRDVSYDEGASFGIPLGTALQGLYSHLKLPFPSQPAKKEEILLVWGGSTAVGHFVVQLAALSGFRVFVTASPATHEGLKQLGAEQCFDYRDEDIVHRLKEAAGEVGIKYAFDTVSEGGTGVKIVDAMGPQGGRVITLLIQPDAKERRKDVQVEFILLYLVLGPHKAFGLPAWPQDRPPITQFIQNELPTLLQGWVAGQGSPKLKPHTIRPLEGGLDKIVSEGYEIMRKGNYGREKLVFPIA